MPRPGRFTPGKTPGTHCTGGWVSPRAGLDGCGKSCPHRDSIPGRNITIRKQNRVQLLAKAELFFPHHHVRTALGPTLPETWRSLSTRPNEWSIRLTTCIRLTSNLIIVLSFVAICIHNLALIWKKCPQQERINVGCLRTFPCFALQAAGNGQCIRVGIILQEDLGISNL
jgi:hypothetical protein